MSLREMGPEAFIAQAAEELPAHLRQTAYATAAEIMRSDGVLEEEEERILLAPIPAAQAGDAADTGHHRSDGCASQQPG